MIGPIDTSSTGEITLLRTSGCLQQALALVLPALGQSILHTGATPGWTVWLTPPFRPNRRALQGIGLNPRHSRVVHGRSGSTSGRHLIELALRSTANALVLAWPTACDEDDLRAFRSAARAGRSFGLLFVSDQLKEVRETKPDVRTNEIHHPPTLLQQLTFNIGDKQASCSANRT